MRHGAARIRQDQERFKEVRLLAATKQLKKAARDGDTQQSRDGGVDLIASRVDEVGLEQTIYVQCKDHARPVGVEVVRELIGILPVAQPTQAILAARSGVTSDARVLAERRGVKIWDEEALVALEGPAG